MLNAHFLIVHPLLGLGNGAEPTCFEAKYMDTDLFLTADMKSPERYQVLLDVIFLGEPSLTLGDV